jgi:hypothetical protein
MVMAIDPRGRVLNPLVADVCGQQCFAYRGQFVVKAGEAWQVLSAVLGFGAGHRVSPVCSASVFSIQ